MTLFMFYKLLNTYKKRYYYYNRFLLERYLHNYNFNRIKNIVDVTNFYRDRKHFINFKKEKDYLNEYFK